MAIRYDSCADPGIFVKGGGGGSRSIWHKKLWQRFSFFFFLVLNLFYRSSVVTFKGNYHFTKVPVGMEHFPGWGGGQTFFPVGVQLLFPYRNPYNLWFSSGDPDPLPPLLWIYPFDSTHRGLIYLLVFSLFFINITFANSFLERGGNVHVASAVVVVTKVSLHSQCMVCQMR